MQDKIGLQVYPFDFCLRSAFMPHRDSVSSSSQNQASLLKKSWREVVLAYLDKRALVLLFLGVSAGIPLLLIVSSLSLWLREAGVERGTVTMFSWAALGYSFKFIWAPLVDAVPLPFLTRILGRRRAWLLLSQILVIVAIVWMGNIDPSDAVQLSWMAFGAVLLGFSSATQDIVVDAYRIESAPPELQSVLSAMYIMGYRVGMIVSGAGALFLAYFWGSTMADYHYEAWRNTYWVMAGMMGIGVVTTLLIREPSVVGSELEDQSKSYQASDYGRLAVLFVLAVVAFVWGFRFFGTWVEGLALGDVGAFLAFLIEVARLGVSLFGAIVVGVILVNLRLAPKAMVYQTWIAPIVDFFRRYGKKALLLLALIGLYRISDIVAGVISNVFYQDLGFSKMQIATAVKTLGIWVTIGGGFLGGLLAQRLPIMRAMMVGAILACTTNLLFVVLTNYPTIEMMYLAVVMDNLASGLASAVFVAFMSALTSIRFTAVQYAIFSSLMTLIPKTLGGYSGAIVSAHDYAYFFTLTFLLGLPVLFLVYWVGKKVPIVQAENMQKNDDL